jgi:hypothetical protein
MVFGTTAGASGIAEFEFIWDEVSCCLSAGINFGPSSEFDVKIESSSVVVWSDIGVVDR